MYHFSSPGGFNPPDLTGGSHRRGNPAVITRNAQRRHIATDRSDSDQEEEEEEVERGGGRRKTKEVGQRND